MAQRLRLPLRADTKMIGRDYFGLLPNGYYYRKDVRKSLPRVADAWKGSWAAALAQNQRRSEPASARRGSQPDYQRGPAGGAPGYSNQGVPYPGAAQQPGPYNGPPGEPLALRFHFMTCCAAAVQKHIVHLRMIHTEHNCCLTASWWASCAGGHMRHCLCCVRGNKEQSDRTMGHAAGYGGGMPAPAAAAGQWDPYSQPQPYAASGAPAAAAYQQQYAAYYQQQAQQAAGGWRR